MVGPVGSNPTDGAMSKYIWTEEDVIKHKYAGDLSAYIKAELEREEDQDQDLILHTNTESENPMNNSTEFTAVTVHLTAEQVAVLRDNAANNRTDNTRHVPGDVLDALAAALPPLIELSVGMEYEYAGGSAYRIVQLGETEAVLMRLVSNVKGERGSTFVERQDKIRKDLLNNRALIIEPPIVDPGLELR